MINHANRSTKAFLGHLIHQWLSKSSMLQNHLEGLLKTGSLVSALECLIQWL